MKIILFILFISYVLFELHFLFVLYKNRKNHTSNINTKKDQSSHDLVSVIVCFRNDVDLLVQLIQKLQHQNHLNFEILLVNDGSNKENLDLLLQEKRKYKFRLFHTNAEQQGKKQALQIGIQNATGKYLCFTDVDCEPNSNLWIDAMTQPLVYDFDVSLGYAPYRKRSNIVNTLVQYETLLAAKQYLSSALSKNAYMAVGRNLAMNQKAAALYIQTMRNNKLPYGDDDLFIAQQNDDLKITAQIEPQSFMLSEAPSTFTEWMTQKQRHLSTGKYYPLLTKAKLFVYAAVQLLVLLLLIAALLQHQFTIALIIIGLKILFSGCSFLFYRNALQLKMRLYHYIILEFLFPLYYVFFTNVIFLSNARKW